VRWLGIIGFLAALAALPAAAIDASRPCLDLPADNRGVDGSLVQPAAPQPLLTQDQCDSMKTHELRALLLEVPQEREDPMQLSIGVKNRSGMLRFKIPFSF